MAKTGRPRVVTEEVRKQVLKLHRINIPKIQIARILSALNGNRISRASVQLVIKLNSLKK